MDLKEVEAMLEGEVGVLLYFSGEKCAVCHALRPKFKALFDAKFPQIKQVYLDAQAHTEISMSFQVFSVPTMLIFLDGKEFIREGRAVSLYQLEQKLIRPYEMMTE
jgi:thioredoxin-like negative regulator of GroEL